ncbi:Phosphatases II [Mycena venus]|uniref:Phosphatases II n=1 Tax=Mycena venus TaxID=2733690 RepID=A0A8H6Y135_9AGAR|nr:Phosphatases II [Mycena venus]
MALGRLVGTRWAPMGYCFGMIIYQGMFCLGMIWRMDPYRMPKAFCLAQTIGMSIGLYIIGGFCLVFCIATSLHILKPKQWGDLPKAFKWRPVYYLPVIVFPLVATAIRVFLLLKYDAVQPFDALHCDAAEPLMVRLAGSGLPALLTLPSSFCLAIYSARHVFRTLQHIKRARCDDNELPRQMRRERQSGHHSFKQSGPVVIEGDDARPPNLGRQPIDPASLPAKAKPIKRLSFHLPFFRRLQSISQSLTPPPSPHQSAGPYEDGRSSIASSSFPTFAPVIDKPGLFTNHRANEHEHDGNGDGSRTWIDEDSYAPTSLESHEMPEALELDVKNQDDDDGTFRLSYRENANCTPSRISHLAYIPLQTPQIRRMLICQLLFPISTLLSIVCNIADAVTHDGPRPIRTEDVIQLSLAWTGALVFGSLQSVRTEIVSRVAFWRR